MADYDDDLRQRAEAAEAMIATMRSKFATLIAEIKVERANNAAVVEELNAQLAEQVAAAEASEQKVARLADYARVQRDERAAIATRLEAEQAASASMAQEARDAQAAAAASVEEAQAAAAAADEQFQEACGQIASLEEKMARLYEYCRVAQGERDALRSRVADLEDAASPNDGTAGAGVEAERQRSAELESQLSAERAAAAEWRERCEELERRAAELESQAGSADAAPASADVAALQAELAERDRKIEELEARVRELESAPASSPAAEESAPSGPPPPPPPPPPMPMPGMKKMRIPTDPDLAQLQPPSRAVRKVPEGSSAQSQIADAIKKGITLRKTGRAVPGALSSSNPGEAPQQDSGVAMFTPLRKTTSDVSLKPKTREDVAAKAERLAAALKPVSAQSPHQQPRQSLQAVHPQPQQPQVQRVSLPAPTTEAPPLPVLASPSPPLPSSPPQSSSPTPLGQATPRMSGGWGRVSVTSERPKSRVAVAATRGREEESRQQQAALDNLLAEIAAL